MENAKMEIVSVMKILWENHVNIVYILFNVEKCPNDCSKNGKCVKGICHCENEFKGIDCSKKACLNNCNKNGVCKKKECKCLKGI